MWPWLKARQYNLENGGKENKHEHVDRSFLDWGEKNGIFFILKCSNRRDRNKDRTEGGFFQYWTKHQSYFRYWFWILTLINCYLLSANSLFGLWHCFKLKKVSKIILNFGFIFEFALVKQEFRFSWCIVQMCALNCCIITTSIQSCLIEFRFSFNDQFMLLERNSRRIIWTGETKYQLIISEIIDIWFRFIFGTLNGVTVGANMPKSGRKYAGTLLRQSRRFIEFHISAVDETFVLLCVHIDENECQIRRLKYWRPPIQGIV